MARSHRSTGYAVVPLLETRLPALHWDNKTRGMKVILGISSCSTHHDGRNIEKRAMNKNNIIIILLLSEDHQPGGLAGC
jgi:hypothetical protein